MANKQTKLDTLQHYFFVNHNLYQEIYKEVAEEGWLEDLDIPSHKQIEGDTLYCFNQEIYFRMQERRVK